jgi:hypothetical protein
VVGLSPNFGRVPFLTEVGRREPIHFEGGAAGEGEEGARVESVEEVGGRKGAHSF